VAESPALEGRILIVDDEPANVRLLERILAAAGYREVHATTDAREAQATFSRIQPDLVLLDLHMPHLDGLAVMAQLQDLIPADAFVPVLVLTADATAAAMREALAAGAKDFLVKPFDRTEVLLRIGNLLQTRSLHVDLQRHNHELQSQLRQQAERQARLAAERRECHGRIARVLAGHGFAMVFQPIARLDTGQVIGAEALARFAAAPVRPPDQWFAEAATVGLGTDLELAAITAAIGRLDDLPSGAYLSINASPETACASGLPDALAAAPVERVVLELTEHAQVEDYPRLERALADLRSRGMRLAVDDAGSGYASLQHILSLSPDIIKLDCVLTRGVDTDPARRALASALVGFARDIGALIVAEGVETPGELEVLREIGVTHGQGYYLGHPQTLPIPSVVAAVLSGTLR
jgi:EAL domain-containing protein (putative c-di-GMP-specific phosphodiesterase class I)